MLNWVIATVRKGRVLVRMHMMTFWVFKFRNVVPHIILVTIRPNFQKYSKKTKQIFAAKPPLKTANFSQFGLKKAKFPTLCGWRLNWSHGFGTKQFRF